MAEVFSGGVDLSLRYREPRGRAEAEQVAALHAVDRYCEDYEARIREMGGIGFFLGGIGPDGHVAFNCWGSDRHSTTRLTHLNYPSQAAAANDLGGISAVQQHAVLTVGLGTIAFREDAVAIVFAAGGSKAAAVRQAVEGAGEPAATLHGLPRARFYLTHSAAGGLAARRAQRLAAELARARRGGELAFWGSAHRAAADVALSRSKAILDLREEDFRAAGAGGAVVLAELEAWHQEAHPEQGRDGGLPSEFWGEFLRAAHDRLAAQVRRGLDLRDGARFLHTAPHHDDIMLGYLPYIKNRLTPRASVPPDAPGPAADPPGREEGTGDGRQHVFCYCTSGFNSVTNKLMAEILRGCRDGLSVGGALRADAEAGRFSPEATRLGGRDADVELFLQGHALRDPQLKERAMQRRALRCVAGAASLQHTDDTASGSANELLAEVGRCYAYYAGQVAGVKDPQEFQHLKGTVRELEGDLVWGYHGFTPSKHVEHLRMGFYKGDTFSEEPQMSRDVQPLMQLLTSQSPDVVTVALDPEGSGPDTHYKVLQAVAAAVKGVTEGPAATVSKKNLRMLGYRNVWFRFHPFDSQIMVPVSFADFAHMNDAFETCFLSQKDAEFPSPE